MSGWDDEEFDEGEDFEEWDGKFSREHLKVDRLYYEQPTGMYFYTPDGVGCIWFDTREEALEEVHAVHAGSDDRQGGERRWPGRGLETAQQSHELAGEVGEARHADVGEDQEE